VDGSPCGRPPSAVLRRLRGAVRLPGELSGSDRPGPTKSSRIVCKDWMQ
jgi:hypothetical protein